MAQHASDDLLKRSIAAEAAYRRLDTADRLDDLLVAAKGLKLKLAAAHKYPLDPAEAARYRRENRSFLGGIDLSDEIDLADELILSLVIRIRLQKDGS